MVLIVPIFVMVVLRAASSRTRCAAGPTTPRRPSSPTHEQPVAVRPRRSRMLFTVQTLRRQYVAWLFIGAGVRAARVSSPLYFERASASSPFGRGRHRRRRARAAAFVGVRRRRAVDPEVARPRAWASRSSGPAGSSCRSAVPAAAALGADTVARAADRLIAQLRRRHVLPAVHHDADLVSPARVRTHVVQLRRACSSSSACGSVHLHRRVRCVRQPRHALGILALVPYWIIGGLVLRSGHKFVDRRHQRGARDPADDGRAAPPRSGSTETRRSSSCATSTSATDRCRCSSA